MAENSSAVVAAAAVAVALQKISQDSEIGFAEQDSCENRAFRAQKISQISEIGFAEQDSCENRAFGNLENGIWKSGI